MDHSSIVTLPHKHLRNKSQRVRVIDDKVKKLIDNMKEATLSWEDSRQHEVGVALAAVQVNELKRVVIVRNNFEDKSDRTFQAFINPEITKLEGDMIEDFEGCLSVKGVYGKVPRYNKVRVKALDLDGTPVRIKAEGFLARVFQHEIDHTKGVMFIDHIKDKADSFFRLKEDGSLDKLDYDKDIKNKKDLWE